MSPTYEQNKKHIYKYRQAHMEEYKQYTKQYLIEYTKKNRDKALKYQYNRRHFLREAKIFRNILLEDSIDDTEETISRA